MRDSGDKCLKYGIMTEELTVFTDSGWAGCKETRKPSNAGVLMLGGHTMKAYTRKQKVIAKSSAKAELCSSIGSVGSKGSPKHDANTSSTGRESETQMWRTGGRNQITKIASAQSQE